MTMINIPFLVAQATPLFNLGPFQVSRSVDPGTLAGGFVILFGLLRILRKLEKRWETLNRVLFGEKDPDDKETVISLGLIKRVEMIEDECPVLHHHRRKEDETAYLHLRRSDRANDNGERPDDGTRA